MICATNKCLVQSMLCLWIDILFAFRWNIFNLHIFFFWRLVMKSWINCIFVLTVCVYVVFCGKRFVFLLFYLFFITIFYNKPIYKKPSTKVGSKRVTVRAPSRSFECLPCLRQLKIKKKRKVIVFDIFIKIDYSLEIALERKI